ncbi:GNAT family N-acetyltransferase [Lysinibacillus fusiformis]|uniref:Acetyltransferase (GNAT) family protein n=1 Tax=Lysinibacillus fusiformis TaxID=28031 RepID=A0A1H9ATW7_9BACI|nr:GNAT family protein [Lysinibacillus fusiformis]SCX82577.1 Acetyltransferase (GNAT) family protein [Lysinibacillus fusiformis]SEM77398.1 Acetyltransferase (GNAT) family protein [Lysinibacillus fusiformis]SEP79833.1 Acetyltransferase (GNAT) family protein [Lysinibacillus fusiformis]
MALTLKFYEDKAQSLVDQYTITEEQLRYTKSPKDSIELAKEDDSRHAVLAFDGDKLVTFFVLHEKEGVKPYSSNERALLIRSFSTDYHEQGKGYAKAALQMLPDFVRLHFPLMNELVLGVNVPNITAQALYIKCGFVDEGKQATGLGEELKVMSYYIKDVEI